MAILIYLGNRLIHSLEDSDLLAPSELLDPGDVHGIALSVGRISKDRPAGEEIIAFSTFVGARWFVYEPFHKGRYFSWLFPLIIEQTIKGAGMIHFNLSSIHDYHETLLREFKYVVGHPVALTRPRFYERDGSDYHLASGVDLQMAVERVRRLADRLMSMDEEANHCQINGDEPNQAAAANRPGG